VQWLRAVERGGIGGRLKAFKDLSNHPDDESAKLKKALKRAAKGGAGGGVTKKKKVTKTKNTPAALSDNIGAAKAKTAKQNAKPKTCCHKTKASQLVACVPSFRAAYMKSGQYFDLNPKCGLCAGVLSGKSWYCFVGFENQRKLESGTATEGGVCDQSMCDKCKDKMVLDHEVNGKGRSTRNGGQRRLYNSSRNNDDLKR
jgi:hypothetical protein